MPEFFQLWHICGRGQLCISSLGLSAKMALLDWCMLRSGSSFDLHEWRRVRHQTCDVIVVSTNCGEHRVTFMNIHTRHSFIMTCNIAHVIAPCGPPSIHQGIELNILGFNSVTRHQELRPPPGTPRRKAPNDIYIYRRLERVHVSVVLAVLSL